MLYSQFLQSQITFGEIHKREINVYIAPKPLDSLYNFGYYGDDYSEFHSKAVANHISEDEINVEFSKKYIGQIFYLPKIENYKNGFSIVSKKVMSISDNKGKPIMTNIYKAISFSSENASCITRDQGGYKFDNESYYDSYYEVIEVQNKTPVWEKISGYFTSLRENNISVYYVKPGDYGGDEIFTLVKKDTKDTIYIDNERLHKFTFVPYFVKLKKVYDGKTMIAINKVDINSIGNREVTDESTNTKIEVPHLSKWKCEINLLKDSSCPRFIFKNESGQTIVLDQWYNGERNSYFNNLYFITEEEYVKRENFKKLKLAEKELEKTKKINK
jgi:hypothetical protein